MKVNETTELRSAHEKLHADIIIAMRSLDKVMKSFNDLICDHQDSNIDFNHNNPNYPKIYADKRGK